MGAGAARREGDVSHGGGHGAGVVRGGDEGGWEGKGEGGLVVDSRGEKRRGEKKGRGEVDRRCGEGGAGRPAPTILYRPVVGHLVSHTKDKHHNFYVEIHLELRGVTSGARYPR